MLIFKQAVTNPDKYAVLGTDGERVATILKIERNWYLTHVYCSGLTLKGLKEIRNKIKELYNATV